MNFDGACRGNLGVSGFGAVVRNAEGDLILGTYGALGRATNIEAKIHALLAGLNLCVNNSLSNIIIEGDSLIVINGIIKSKFENKKLSKWIPCISHLLSSIGIYEVTHTYREGNWLADFLANLGIDSSNGAVVFDRMSAPENVRD
ncbi:hypothetical protein SUGI_0910340 [Cryptomeria japonica]|nr:hypothetical protein SUGI_0910340 [Cryptomeria japonica]